MAKFWKDDVGLPIYVARTSEVGIGNEAPCRTIETVGLNTFASLSGRIASKTIEEPQKPQNVERQ